MFKALQVLNQWAMAPLQLPTNYKYKFFKKIIEIPTHLIDIASLN
jgi:hypothetical protein